MDIPDIYTVPFHESANKPDLMLGCEPVALMAAFVIAIIIGFSVPHWWGILGATLLFLFLRQMLREMAKQDPILLKVHHESQRYNQGFWTAKPLRTKRWR